jgi:hypothetical protein
MKKLQFPTIARPCPKKWENLRGDNQKRFCDECQLHVHNLSAMSEKEVQALLQIPGRCCVGYLSQPESPRPVAKTRKNGWGLLGRVPRIMASGTALAVSFLLSGCDEKASSTASAPVVPPPVSTNSNMILGDICVVPPPATNRVERSQQ